MPTQKKIDTVSEMTDKVGKAKSIVFAQYKGLKHKQLEDLRKALKKVNAEFMVAKNRLLIRALGDIGSQAAESLQGDTGAVFSYQDEVVGVKELVKFFKTANIGKTKGGVLGDRLLTAAEVTTLSEIPGKEILLAQLVGQLQAPISGLHYALSWNINKLVWALNNIKDKKE